MFELKDIPNGVVATVSTDSARYHSFTASLRNLKLSPGSPAPILTGVNVASSCNNAVDFMYKNKLEWVWYMGDDHTFDREILLKMLVKMYSKDLDILTALCPFRKPPFGPVMFSEEDKERPGFWKTIHWWDIKDQSGEMEVFASGSAGMLVRKRVFDKMEKPYFRVGQDRPDAMSEDLNFCKRARQSGFKVLVDLDNHLGHTANCTVLPHKDENGNWGFALDFGFNTKFALVPVKDNENSVYDSANDEIVKL